METTTSKGSSKRKPAFTMKVKVPKPKKLQSDSDEDDFSDHIPLRKNRTKGDNSDQSDVESIPDLPEGTVIVKPEAVKEKKPRFSGPEFSKAPENLDIVNCTSCGRQINPNVSGAAKRHPKLKVLVCRKCFVYYRSGKIEQDEDGLDEQCRWCGEGGRLSGCDFCHNAFCKSCIIRNFSRAEFTRVTAEDGQKWKCYVCEPSKLKKLLQECDSLFKKIEKEKMKAKMQSKNADSKKSLKSSKSDGKSSAGRMFNKDLISVSGITVSSTNLVDTVSQLLGLTAGFQTMLEVLKSGIIACGDVEHSSRDLNRGAKTLETGLRQFLKSLNEVVADSSSKNKSAIENGETTEDESIVSNGLISLSDDEEDVVRNKKDTKRSPEKKSSQGQRKSSGKVFPKKGLHVTTSSEVVEIKNSDIDTDDDLPITFGPVGGSNSNTKPKEDQMEIEPAKEELNESMISLGETENEAAQLELLQELAEEMCKEQKEQKEEKEEEEREEKEEKEEREKQTNSKKKEEKKKEKTKTEDKNDSPMDKSDFTENDSDDVSSSDLLMSSDGNFDDSKIFWPKRRRKEKDRQPSRKTKETKSEKKIRKKREKKEKKGKKEKCQKKKKGDESKQKGGKKDVDSSDSGDDLDKEIDKLEEEPEKKKKTTKDHMDASGDDNNDSDNVQKEDTQKKNEKKSANSSEDTKGKAKQTKKKKAASSSSDDDNDDVDDVDEEDEEDEEDSGTKLKNGKAKLFEEENGDGDDLEKAMAKKALMAEMDDDNTDDEDQNMDDDDSDSDEKSKKKGKGGKAIGKKSASSAKKKKDEEDVDGISDEGNADKDGNEEDDEDDDDSDAVPNKRKRLRSKLLNAKISGSDSDAKKKKSKKKGKMGDSDSDEVIVRKKLRKQKNDSTVDESSEEDENKKKKKGKGKGKGKGKKKTKKQKKGKKRKLGSDSDSLSLSSSSSSEDSDSEVSLDTSEEERREKLKEERKAKRKAASAKRRRIKQQVDSTDEDKKKSDATPDEDDSDDDDDDESKSPDKSGRKNIRKIKSDKKLTDDTKRARKAEEARRKRVAERQKAFNHIVQIKDEQSECPITTQLILEIDKETEKPIIEVNKKLVRKLKPHQVEACQFMWDCLCESLDRIKKKEGSGCILAHCMGLGKTLSVISFVHTMLKNEKLTKMRTCLIVCPLNTVINWRNEWDMWFDEKDKVDIYEMTMAKQNWVRADYLKDWHDGGGIMIIGYEMYRNLTGSARIKNKKLKAIFQSTLVDPGPDLVVCDEGHILKNDSSAVSQAMNKIRTRRRVVLTGTPLQNNLIEYHCMTSFVKPNLMGTRKEFLNRFVNPITNGQHSDSTAYDVKVMGRRAHVLHEMLAGCVQRRDYSALTKFLPPKFEYVISVRLTPKQIELYQKYLDLGGITMEGPGAATKGARLFSDYQNLMKIWTHPWVLKLSEIRAEQRMKYDDSEDSFIDNSTSEGEESMSHSDTSDSEKSKKKSDSEESQEAGPSSGPRRSRRGKPPPEDSDKDEVVKDWKTRSRGGEGDDDDLTMDVDEGPRPVSKEWWAEYVKEEDENELNLGGKLILLFEILRMCEDIGDKVLIFSQSLLSLDIIEYFLDYIDKQAQEEAHQKALEEVGKKNEGKDKDKKKEKEGDEEKKEDAEKKDEDEVEQPEFGKSWTKGADYFRMDGSTSPQLRSQWADVFNDPDNFRARLFLISTRAGSLGINLVAANRVIIFDASWNPSHDVQSIFRVYRFGQTKPCYVYRFLAQGTMEEKIYERQVTKQSLSQRVVDEHQIDRHFTANDLTELYNFKPDRLDDPNRPKVVHSLPKDVLLAELLKSKDTYISKFHEHDSLLENRQDQTLSEEDKKAAWEDYENERKGVSNRVAQASTASGMGMFSPDNVMQIVQMVKMRFPNLPPDMFQAQVQAILQQQILYQQSLQKQQIEQQRMMEMQRLHRIQQDIRSQQRQINSMTSHRGMNPMLGLMGGQHSGPMPGLRMRAPHLASSLRNMLSPSGSKKDDAKNKPPTVIDLSNS